MSTIRNFVFDELDGCEVRTAALESELGVVLIDNGRIIIDGKPVAKAKVTDKLLKQLWSDYFYEEFGTHDINALL